METQNTIFHVPRKYNNTELWKNVTEEQWNDANWQVNNSIRSVEQLKKIILELSYEKRLVKLASGRESDFYC